MAKRRQDSARMRAAQRLITPIYLIKKLCKPLVVGLQSFVWDK